MHLEVTKNNKWGNFPKTFFLKKVFFRRQFLSELFFFTKYDVIFGARWEQEGNECSGCIWNEFSKWVGTHEIFQRHEMSKKKQKQAF